MKLTEEQIEKGVRDGLKALKNCDKNVALVYPDGFVPNSYKWPAPAQRIRVNIKGSYTIERYDRKRSYGHGSYITLWKQ